MSNLPYRLSVLRKERNLTQKDIADYLNISHQAYSRYENGEREPNIDMLMALAYLFKVSIDALVGFAFDIGSSEEEKAFYDELSRRTGYTKTNFVVEGIKHIPEARKAKKENRKIQPKTKRMEEIKKASDEIKQEK